MHYIVTEYGVAYLHGKSIQERALALISIAHPKFRAQLFHEAIEARYLRQELAQVEDKFVIASPEMRTPFVLEDGTQVTFRPVHPAAAPRPPSDPARGIDEIELRPVASTPITARPKSLALCLPVDRVFPPAEVGEFPRPCCPDDRRRVRRRGRAPPTTEDDGRHQGGNHQQSSTDQAFHRPPTHQRAKPRATIPVIEMLHPATDLGQDYLSVF